MTTAYLGRSDKIINYRIGVRGPQDSADQGLRILLGTPKTLGGVSFDARLVCGERHSSANIIIPATRPFQGVSVRVEGETCISAPEWSRRTPIRFRSAGFLFRSGNGSAGAGFAPETKFPEREQCMQISFPSGNGNGSAGAIWFSERKSFSTPETDDTALRHCPLRRVGQRHAHLDNGNIAM